MQMEELMAYRQELIAALMRGVGGLAHIVKAIPPHAWQTPSSPAGCSSHFTLAHLRVLEEQVFIPNLHRIQTEAVPILTIFDDRAWMGVHHHPQEPFQKMMEGYSQLRVQEVDWLRDLPGADWSRMGRHPWWGLRSFQWWVERQLESYRQHTEQLSAFLTS